MAYYGIRNVYRPSRLVKRAYGFSSAPPYRNADIPTAAMDQPRNMTAEQFKQQFAYEWFQFGDTGKGWGGVGYSNPPFVSGAAGRLHPLLISADGGPARILRGFIRRADYEVEDEMSRSRLYFMFNPEVITRDYVSYLDQGALDPFNTVFQSKNLVAPPSFMDFTFELFFDRQEEAADPKHPGVFVDYQYFDMVVRNVVPSDAEMTGNTLPDNGVMMVNPRDITVVFSPQITVQGRPLNARVSFERFTHRMVPTRMRIALTMRVIYMGPIKAMSEYKAENFAAEETVPLDEVKTDRYEWTFEKLETTQEFMSGASADLTNVNVAPGATVVPSQVQDFINQKQLSGDANAKARTGALQWAMNNVVEGSTRYDNGGGRKNLPASADCSGLVALAYQAVGAYDEMGWDTHGDSTYGMNKSFEASGWRTAQRISISNAITPGYLQPGDLIYRINTSGGSGHVVFFLAYEGDNLQIFDAASPSSNPPVGKHSYSKSNFSDYSYAVRPTPFGQSMAANQVASPATASAGAGTGAW